MPIRRVRWMTDQLIEHLNGGAEPDAASGGKVPREDLPFLEEYPWPADQ